MINKITQSISPITPLPGLLAENRPAAVNTLVEQELPQNSIEMQSLVGQVNTFIGQTNTTADEVLANATLAQGLANYQGDWTSKGYTLGQTVSVSGVYYICKLTHATGQNPTAGGSIYWSLAFGNWSLKVDADMSGYTEKTTPIDADLVPLSNSAASFGIKKLTWANIKATLKTYLDTLYVALVGNQTIAGTKTFSTSPIFPTPTAQDNSTKAATTAYVDGKMVRGTAVNSTSGTSIDFTGIPSWAKRITIMFNGVSTNGTAWKLIQIGSGSIQTTGYTSTGSSISAAPASTNTSTGFLIQSISATDTISGIITLTNISGNLWICNHSAKSSINTTCVGGGDITLAGALDRLRITTSNGTDTFDAGSINIMYEG